MGMGMGGKGTSHACGDAGVAVAELRGFADFRAIAVISDDQAGAGFHQPIPLGHQSTHQIIPGFGKGEILGEERPQGCDKPLIRLVSLPRALAAIQITMNGIFDQVSQRCAFCAGNPFKRRPSGRGEGYHTFHPASIAPDG